MNMRSTAMLTMDGGEGLLTMFSSLSQNSMVSMVHSVLLVELMPLQWQGYYSEQPTGHSSPGHYCCCCWMRATGRIAAGGKGITASEPGGCRPEEAPAPSLLAPNAEDWNADGFGACQSRRKQVELYRTAAERRLDSDFPTMAHTTEVPCCENQSPGGGAVMGNCPSPPSAGPGARVQEVGR